MFAGRTADSRQARCEEDVEDIQVEFCSSLFAGAFPTKSAYVDNWCEVKLNSEVKCRPHVRVIRYEWLRILIIIETYWGLRYPSIHFILLSRLLFSDYNSCSASIKTRSVLQGRFSLQQKVRTWWILLCFFLRQIRKQVLILLRDYVN